MAANTVTEQRIIDNNKRALIKYTFISDGTDGDDNLLVDVSMLSNTLNANGYLMVSNTHPKSIYRTTIKRIFGQAKANGSFNLQWEGDTNTSIVRFGTGPFDFDFHSMGDGATLPNPEANATGDILLSLSGMQVNDFFTLFIDLRKDARDYNAGQLNDPVAFNRGPGAMV